MKHIANRWFKIGNMFVDVVIIFNFIMTFLSTITNVPYSFSLEFFCVSVFVIEIVIRLCRFGFSFFYISNGEKIEHDNKIGWNYFDLIITFVSVVGLLYTQSSSLASLRIIRSIRMISLFSHQKRLKSMLSAMLDSIQGIFVAIIALAIIFTIYAVIGYDLFASIQPQFFGDGWVALLTMFQMMILNGWETVAIPIIRTYPIIGSIYFVTFIFITAFIMLNIITGVIVDSMAEASRDRRMKNRIKRDHQQEMLNRLKSLENKIDELNNKLGKK